MIQDVTAQTPEVPEGPGSAPSGGNVKEFDVSLVSFLFYRENLRLTEGSGTGTTIRNSLDFGWSIRNERTVMIASFAPYYEYFVTDPELSTWGGSAGFGWTRQTSRRQTWHVFATILAAPEQDVARPPTSDEPQAPDNNILVPRNGFVSTTLNAGDTIQLSPKSSLDVSLIGTRENYDAFDVGEAPQDLVSQSGIELATIYSYNTSPRHAWSIAANVSRVTLERNIPIEDERLQYRVSYGSSFVTGPRSNTSFRVGVTSLEDERGNSKVAPLVYADWSLIGETVSTGFVLRRDQGVFTGSTSSVEYLSLGGTLAWRLGHKGNMGVSLGYGVYGGLGEIIDPDEGTRANNYSLFYRETHRKLSWFIIVSQSEQRSEASFGNNLNAASATAGLSWLLASKPL